MGKYTFNVDVVPEDYTGLTQSEIKIKIAEAQIESNVGQFLSNLYRGYRWYVGCNSFGGIVEIKCLDLNGEYGFIIHLKKLMSDPMMTCVMKAGGELLERCGLPTTKLDAPALLEKDRDLRGNVIGDTHGA